MDNNLKNICLKLMKNNEKITNLRLQKFLYFIQVFCLIKYDTPAFNEKIEAWPYGPVVPEAYFAYKRMELRLNVNEPIILDEKIEIAITQVTEMFSGWNDFSIVDLTHEYSIWKNKINSVLSGKEMTIGEIKDFHIEKFKNTGNAI